MNVNQPLPFYKQRLLIAMLTSAGLSISSGCGSRAVVDPPAEPLATAQRIKDWPVNQHAPVLTAEEQGAWYNEFAAAEIHPLDQQPASASHGHEEPVTQTNSGVNAPPSTAGILQAIQNAVEQQRPANTKWSLLLLEAVPEDAKRGGPMEVRIDLGLTKLYAKCPEIQITDMGYEQAMTQLCIKAGIRLAPGPKVKNPIINWRKENVSVYQAFQMISAENGFGARLIGVGGRLTWHARDFSTRESFVKEVVNSIFAKGELLDRDVPLLVTSAAMKPKDPKADGAEDKKPESQLNKLFPVSK